MGHTNLKLPRIINIDIHRVQILLTRAGVVLSATVIPIALSGCYYAQAVRGHVDLMQRRVDIPTVIANEPDNSELARRLKLLQRARDFSVKELSLPDNDSYRSYADLQRDYVVWNVFAAPEFSLQPRRWCFPVAGCVAYRGYFKEAAAQRKADRLRQAGFDVAVGGVAAYSTLGRFDDPILNTMLRWRDVDLIATLFHELAHQVLYVPGDTEFNESFATAVEEAAISRWLEQHGSNDQITGYLKRRDLRDRVVELVLAARADLQTLYSTNVPATEMRERKTERLEELRMSVKRLLDCEGASGYEWLQQDLNNARLITFALYRGRLEEFQHMLDACEGNFPCFFKAAEKAADPDQ